MLKFVRVTMIVPTSMARLAVLMVVIKFRLLTANFITLSLRIIRNIRNLLPDLGASNQRDYLPLLLEGYSQFKEIF